MARGGRPPVAPAVAGGGTSAALRAGWVGNRPPPPRRGVAPEPPYGLFCLWGVEKHRVIVGGWGKVQPALGPLLLDQCIQIIHQGM